MFSSVLNSTVQNFSIQTALLCTGSALIMGLIIAFVYMTGHQYSKSFAITLVLMPPLIETVILVVNGNLGTNLLHLLCDGRRAYRRHRLSHLCILYHCDRQSGIAAAL